MPKFPRTNPEVLALAHTVSNGLLANKAIFTQPATDPATILADINTYEAVRDQITASEAQTKQLYQQADEIMERIDVGTRSNIRYGESIAKGDAATLALFGWGLPSERTALQLPDAPRALEIIGQGDGWVQIDWKEPIGGGKVASYIVQRSEDGAVTWTDAKTETASESILLNQPKAKKLVYQVVAINRAGQSVPSNIINIVL